MVGSTVQADNLFHLDYLMTIVKYEQGLNILHISCKKYAKSLDYLTSNHCDLNVF